jgi:hypothetical protein
MKIKGAIGILAGLITTLMADPVVHTFELWGTAKKGEHVLIYWGWTNGFFQGRPSGLRLLRCIEGISSEQAVAMIDKRYHDHPEKWAHPLGQEIIEALTEAGGPCEGIDPFQKK